MMKSKAVEISIPNTSRLEGPANYQVWSSRISAILEQYKLWIYCTIPTSSPNSISNVEIEGRAAAQQAIIESFKDSFISIVYRF
jgi:hypothetical protein